MDGWRGGVSLLRLDSPRLTTMHTFFAFFSFFSQFYFRFIPIFFPFYPLTSFAKALIFSVFANFDFQRFCKLWFQRFCKLWFQRFCKLLISAFFAKLLIFSVFANLCFSAFFALRWIEVGKTLFFYKIWWKCFYETKCRKNISAKFCSHTDWQLLLKYSGKERWCCWRAAVGLEALLLRHGQQHFVLGFFSFLKRLA